LKETAENCHFQHYASVNYRANRGNYCIFLTVQKWDEPPVARRLEMLPFRIDFQPSAATRFESRENFRAAVFLWITPRETPRAISGWTAFSAAAASAFLPD